MLTHQTKQKLPWSLTSHFYVIIDYSPPLGPQDNDIFLLTWMKPVFCLRGQLGFWVLAAL